MEKINNYIVYKAQNEFTGDVYIGATTNSIHQRKLDHIERSNRGEFNKFHEAISTFGADAFLWEEIDTAESIDELAIKEKHYVLKYKAKVDGYNSDSGGGFKKTVYQYSIVDGRLVNTYNSLQNAGDAVNATKQEISRACLGVNNTYKNYYWSYIYKEPFEPNSDVRKKEVFQFSLDGNLLAKYNSASEASRQSGISKTCITRVCRGERTQTGGFNWEYV